MFEGLFQPLHLLLVLVIVLLIFGPGKLGDIGGALGRSVREFKKALAADDKDSAKDKQIAASAADEPSATARAAGKGKKLQKS